MLMGDAKTELELKVQVPAGFQVPVFDGFDELRCSTMDLAAVYWDTATLALARRGHTLRYRSSSDGSEHTWTLKLSGEGSKFARRREIDLPGVPDTPPDAVVEVVRGLIQHEPLVRVADVSTRRASRRLRHRGSGALVELCNDDVVARRSGGEEQRFRQVEVEVLEGGDEVLEAAAGLLEEAGAGVADPTPKVLRVLAVDRRESGTRPSTVTELVGLAVGQALDQLLAHDPAIRLDGYAEDIHKARVATRRLRSDLKTLERWCDPFRVEGLRSELQWLGGLLGRVRDADVLPGTLTARAEELTGFDDDAVRTIVGLVGEDRRRALAVLRDVMNSSRYLGLLADLERLAAAPPLRPDVDPAQSAKGAGRRGMAHAFDRVTKRVEDLPAHPAMEHLHEVRKAAKRARYGAELLSVLSNGATDAMADRMAELQDQLGLSQDAVTAHSWLTERNWTEIPPAVVFTAGRLAQSFAQDVASTPNGWRRTWRRASSASMQRWFR